MSDRETLDFIASTASKLAEMAQNSKGRVLNYLLRMAAEAAAEEAKSYGSNEQTKPQSPAGDPNAPG